MNGNWQSKKEEYIQESKKVKVRNLILLILAVIIAASSGSYGVWKLRTYPARGGAQEQASARTEERPSRCLTQRKSHRGGTAVFRAGRRRKRRGNGRDGACCGWHIGYKYHHRRKPFPRGETAGIRSR